MIEFTYRLEPRHLAAYRRLAAKRVEAMSIDDGEEWGRWIVYSLVVAVLIAVAYLFFPEVTGRQFGIVEFMFGFVCGIAVCVLVMWWHYGRLSRRAVRSDGPTMSEHRMSVSPDGLKSGSELFDMFYRWSVFEDVSVQDGIIVLWIEPGAGVLVPRNAFADPAAETAFLDAVRGNTSSPGAP